jgi:hygromycin-B 4-O-kinase
VGLESFDAAYARLEELAGSLPTERRLIHQDLINRNVLVTGTKITAVFDWGNAMYGDPLYDAAWLIYWWPWYPQWSQINIREALALPADADHRLFAYQLHIGLDHLAYTASNARWDDLKRNDEQVRGLLAAP